MIELADNKYIISGIMALQRALSWLLRLCQKHELHDAVRARRLVIYICQNVPHQRSTHSGFSIELEKAEFYEMSSYRTRNLLNESPVWPDGTPRAPFRQWERQTHLEIWEYSSPGHCITYIELLYPFPTSKGLQTVVLPILLQHNIILYFIKNLKHIPGAIPQ